MIDVSNILNCHISLCPNIRTKSYQIITLFEALNNIRKATYEKQVANMRRLLSNGNICSYRAKKKQLPSYIFTGIAYGKRYKFDISGYTSLIVIDIDKLADINLVKSQLLLDGHVISMWESPSGKGLKALFYIDYMEPVNADNIWIAHEHCAFQQIAAYLYEKYSIPVDKTGADIARLCFVSSDPNIHLKKEFEPFKVHIDLTKKQIWKIRAKYYYGNKDRCKAIAEMKRISKLTNSNVDIPTSTQP